MDTNMYPAWTTDLQTVHTENADSQGGVKHMIALILEIQESWPVTVMLPIFKKEKQLFFALFIALKNYIFKGWDKTGEVGGGMQG